MVLNMADFGKCWKSLQTLWNAHKPVLKWFVTACATVCVDLGRIRTGRKLADFEQKAWAIAHGFEHGRFSPVLEIAPNSLECLQNRSVCVDLGRIRKCRKLADFEQKSCAIAHGFEHGLIWQFLEITSSSLKRLQNRSKNISDCLRDCLCRFRVNSQGSKIGRWWAKSLGYTLRFWTWRILVSSVNHSKLSETPPKAFWRSF